MTIECQALVIGGGFYGCEVALELERLGLAPIYLVEREPDLFARASYVNQARVHNGYHYPRSLVTAERSQRNFSRFCRDYGEAVTFGTEKIYAIARGSKLNARQFERFCAEIGAEIRPLGSRVSRLFDTTLIEDAFLVTELAFNANTLGDLLKAQLSRSSVQVLTDEPALIAGGSQRSISILTPTKSINAEYVFNCTYAELDRIGCVVRTRIKRQLVELSLISPPPELQQTGVTVMDGPFFSLMPFPAEQCHSLSHVSYTPHASWSDPSVRTVKPTRTNSTFMLRDASRYMPCLSKARHLRSLFDLKAVLERNDKDDGRPILFEQCEEEPRIVSILGSKIDNIYEIRDLLRGGAWVQ